MRWCLDSRQVTALAWLVIAAVAVASSVMWMVS